MTNINKILENSLTKVRYLKKDLEKVKRALEEAEQQNGEIKK